MTFSGDRLRLLRQYHNYTQRDLGAAIGSAASAISNYERGRATPKGDVLLALCAQLRVDEEYLHAEASIDEFRSHETNFRSLAATPQRTRTAVLAHASLFGLLVQTMTNLVPLPKLKMPRIRAKSFEDIEEAAERCRTEWGVGVSAPIENMTLMLEHAGMVVTLLPGEVSRQVDAFSRFGATNLIVLNPAKRSAARARMDLAHEAGHGVLHGDGLPDNLAIREDQANYFAGALLMPRVAFSREFWSIGSARGWDDFIALKARWGASIPAVVVRAYHLGLMNAAEYRRRFKYMSKAGWLRGAEPGEVEPEQPQLFSLMLQQYLSETGQGTADIARSLGWSDALFRELTGLEATDIDHGSKVASIDEFKQRKLSVM